MLLSQVLSPLVAGESETCIELPQERRVMTGGGFQMTIEGVPGEQCVVQASTDLSSSNWVSLCTNVLSSTQTNYTDSGATNSSARYYRALLLE
jgi:hypothetical protein